METPKTVKERKDDILFLMKYAVPEEKAEAAMAFLEKFAADIIALNLLHSFYVHLPEGTDDSVIGLRLVSSRQGVFLLGVETGNYLHYLYMVNNEAAHILGTMSEGIIDKELLEFFGYKDNDEVLSLCREPDKLQEYKPYAPDANLCPSCHAAVGEYHTLGCPVEICPWCNGQLTYCNCRFTRLETETLDKVSQLERLQELLEEKGRIAFRKEHTPGYPTMDDE